MGVHAIASIVRRMSASDSWTLAVCLRLNSVTSMASQTILAGGVVTLMLDCDEEGEKGARQAVYELAAHSRVRLAWSGAMHGGRFKGRQPESLSAGEWEAIRSDREQI